MAPSRRCTPLSLLRPPNTAAHCRRVLSCKFKVRPRSYRSYPIWHACLWKILDLIWTYLILFDHIFSIWYFLILFYPIWSSWIQCDLTWTVLNENVWVQKSNYHDYYILWKFKNTNILKILNKNYRKEMPSIKEEPRGQKSSYRTWTKFVITDHSAMEPKSL